MPAIDITISDSSGGTLTPELEITSVSYRTATGITQLVSDISTLALTADFIAGDLGRISWGTAFQSFLKNNYNDTGNNGADITYTVSTLATDVYNASSVEDTFTIILRDSVITWYNDCSEFSDLIPGDTVTLSASATGGTVMFETGDSNVAMVVGVSTLSAVAGGSTTLTASQSGSDCLIAAQSIECPVSVTDFNLFIIAGGYPVSHVQKSFTYQYTTFDTPSAPSQFVTLSGTSLGALVSGSNGDVSSNFEYSFDDTVWIDCSVTDVIPGWFAGPGSPEDVHFRLKHDLGPIDIAPETFTFTNGEIDLPPTVALAGEVTSRTQPTFWFDTTTVPPGNLDTENDRLLFVGNRGSPENATELTIILRGTNIPSDSVINFMGGGGRNFSIKSDLDGSGYATLVPGDSFNISQPGWKTGEHIRGDSNSGFDATPVSTIDGYNSTTGELYQSITIKALYDSSRGREGSSDSGLATGWGLKLFHGGEDVGGSNPNGNYRWTGAVRSLQLNYTVTWTDDEIPGALCIEPIHSTGIDLTVTSEETDFVIVLDTGFLLHDKHIMQWMPSGTVTWQHDGSKITLAQQKSLIPPPWLGSTQNQGPGNRSGTKLAPPNYFSFTDLLPKNSWFPRAGAIRGVKWGHTLIDPASRLVTDYTVGLINRLKAANPNTYRFRTVVYGDFGQTDIRLPTARAGFLAQFDSPNYGDPGVMMTHGPTRAAQFARDRLTAKDANPMYFDNRIGWPVGLYDLMKEPKSEDLPNSIWGVFSGVQQQMTGWMKPTTNDADFILKLCFSYNNLGLYKYKPNGYWDYETALEQDGRARYDKLFDEAVKALITGFDTTDAVYHNNQGNLKPQGEGLVMSSPGRPDARKCILFLGAGYPSKHGLQGSALYDHISEKCTEHNIHILPVMLGPNDDASVFGYNLQREEDRYYPSSGEPLVEAAEKLTGGDGLHMPEGIKDPSIYRLVNDTYSNIGADADAGFYHRGTEVYPKHRPLSLSRSLKGLYNYSIRGLYSDIRNSVDDAIECGSCNGFNSSHSTDEVGHNVMRSIGKAGNTEDFIYYTEDVHWYDRMHYTYINDTRQGTYAGYPVDRPRFKHPCSMSLQHAIDRTVAFLTPKQGRVEYKITNNSEFSIQLPGPGRPQQLWGITDNREFAKTFHNKTEDITSTANDPVGVHQGFEWNHVHYPFTMEISRFGDLQTGEYSYGLPLIPWAWTGTNYPLQTGPFVGQWPTRGQSTALNPGMPSARRWVGTDSFNAEHESTGYTPGDADWPVPESSYNIAPYGGRRLIHDDQALIIHPGRELILPYDISAAYPSTVDHDTNNLQIQITFDLAEISSDYQPYGGNPPEGRYVKDFPTPIEWTVTGEPNCNTTLEVIDNTVSIMSKSFNVSGDDTNRDPGTP